MRKQELAVRQKQAGQHHKAWARAKVEEERRGREAERRRREAEEAETQKVSGRVQLFLFGAVAVSIVLVYLCVAKSSNLIFNVFFLAVFQSFW